ncbi:hypothetical protein FGB62_65g010 [Gracilaria domingensis]|nr:hypothetical protein FGB62_65g010 [Gracilaria domingensis]
MNERRRRGGVGGAVRNCAAVARRVRAGARAAAGGRTAERCAAQRAVQQAVMQPRGDTAAKGAVVQHSKRAVGESEAGGVQGHEDIQGAIAKEARMAGRVGVCRRCALRAAFRKAAWIKVKEKGRQTQVCTCMHKKVGAAGATRAGGGSNRAAAAAAARARARARGH